MSEPERTIQPHAPTRNVTSEDLMAVLEQHTRHIKTLDRIILGDAIAVPRAPGLLERMETQERWAQSIQSASSRLFWAVLLLTLGGAASLLWGFVQLQARL